MTVEDHVGSGGGTDKFCDGDETCPKCLEVLEHLTPINLVNRHRGVPPQRLPRSARKIQADNLADAVDFADRDGDGPWSTSRKWTDDERAAIAELMAEKNAEDG